MKRLSTAVVLGLFFSIFSFAQTQTGNASYNASKTGLTISHPSLSFNTRVRVTNLRNNRSIEAIVDYRIPITTERIADISRDAGDALEMARTGMTPVEIEVLSLRETASVTVPVQEPPVQSAPPPPVNTTPETGSGSRQPPPQQAPVQQAQTSAPATTQPLIVQTTTEPQYIPIPTACPSFPCSNTPLLIVILCLLLLVIGLLVVILIILLRRFPFWLADYPVWFRRHYWYAKKRRI